MRRGRYILNKKIRFYELDSLRGLAAMAVLLSHFLLILQSTTLTKFIEYGPFRIFIAGEEAVIMFFILSGFVLSLPFYNDKKPSYSSFIIKRILRIYSPYYVSTFIAILLMHLTYNGKIPSLSAWFNSIWSGHLNLMLIVNHLLLIGIYPNANINPVLWSLVQEMRISLIFPFLMLIVIKIKWWQTIMIGLLLSLLSWILYISFRMSVYGSLYDISLTIHFISMFLLGALLAKYRFHLISLITNLTYYKKIILLILGLISYLYVKPAMLLQVLFSIRDPIIANILDSYCIAIGVALIIILSISTKRTSSILLVKPIQYLGKISYSLYLYHSIILLAVTHLFYNSLNLWYIWLVSLLLSLLISSFSFYLIEKPSIILGRKLFKKNSSEKMRDLETKMRWG